MSKLEKQFREDRELRDAARAVLLADIDHARSSFSAKGVADRIGGRIGDGAKDVFDTARIHADDNRGIIATLIGAILLWLGREPILEILGLSDAAEDELQVNEATAADIQPELTEPSSPGDDHEH